MIKNKFKKIKLVLMLIVILVLVCGISIRIWLGYRFESVVKNLNYPEFSHQIKSSPKLPENVFSAFSKIHAYNQNTTTNQLLMKMPFRILGFGAQSGDCPCVDVNYGFVLDIWDRWTVALKLDNDVGSTKCLEYYLNNFDFMNNQKGIRNAALFYFDKPLESLTDREMLELCLMTKNPSLYNRLRYPENVRKELNNL